jgi:hypothetical protein
MSDFIYTLISRILNCIYWRGTLLSAENLPAHGPAVFVANHLGPAGPIGAACSIPLRMYPWIIADMVDREKAPDYLRMDFVESSLKLKPPLSKLVARAITSISVPLLTSLGCIPVTRGHTQELTISVAVLKEGKMVLVFPEEPEAELDPVTQMRPFLKGFTRLGELYYAETGEKLRFYPVAVHGSRRVMVGGAIAFDPDNPRGAEKLRLMHLLEKQITAMYLELDCQ